MENVLGTLSSPLSRVNKRLRRSAEAEEDVEPLTTSPTTGGFEFEVFLSFRGKDTRKRFIGHLYDDLAQHHGVSTFIDSKKLEKGEEIGKLFEYIERSKIFVPIFSKRYAESKWCLKEVAKSLECGREIIPVFFGVEPSDVGNQRGLFKSAFRKHESNKQLNQEEVSKWRQALKKVGKISGFNLEDMNGDEAKLRRAVIKRVLEKVNKKPLEVAKHPIGIETRVQDVKKRLENGSNVNGIHVVGIHGMGGLGKTTIAKAVYNDLMEGFNGATCFLSNVRENAGQHNGLVTLQKQVFHEILKDGNIFLSDVAHGVSLIKERARDKRVLLILDDVDSVAQLDALAGGRDWFGSGSVIIITTRDEQVLLAYSLKQDEIYKPEVLNTEQSRELFLLHAFNGEEPEGEYLQLSNEVVATAAGLPLTIKVLGSLLTRGMDLEQWQNTLDRLQRIPPTEVQQRLKLSYDRLDQTEQKIFLDISHFFIGQDREYATYMWEDCDWFPKYTINVLVQRSLLKIDSKSGEFEMHDQIRDMGIAIIEEECSRRPEKQSRLWNSQDCLDLLRRKVPGTIDAEAIHIWEEWNGFEIEEYCVSAECFENMPNLRYLIATNVYFQGTSLCFPPSLKVLKLNNCYFDPMPSDFIFEKAVVLVLHNTNIAQVFVNQLPLKAFEKLKVLSIQHAEINVITDLTNIPCLVKLSVAYCSKLATIDESIGQLKNLTDLTLRSNAILGQLPDSIGELSSLRKLNIIRGSIVKIPDSICQLSSLEILNLEYCESLTSLPERLGDMRSLEKLHIQCENIIKVPDSIGQLTNLRELVMRSCKRLSRLPDSICQLSSLEVLDLANCSTICSVPEHIGAMESLKRLDLSETAIDVIPDTICQLSLLEFLNLGRCYNLCSLPERLGDLEKLEELYLHFTRIEVIPESVGRLKNLRLLELKGTCLRSFENDISHLTGINIELTCSSSLLLGLCNQAHKALKHLHLNDDVIEELPDWVGEMGNLQELWLECDMLKGLPNWIERFSEKLTELEVSSKHLKALPDCTGSLKQLESLILNCENLKALPDTVGSLKRMWRLKLNCMNLEGLPDSIGGLANISSFEIESVKLKALPSSIALLKRVWELKLKCPNLEQLPDSIGELESLEYFKMDSDGLICLPNSIGSLRRIRTLEINCPNLEALPDSMEALQHLQRLTLHCDHFSVLPDFIGQLKKLESFSFKSKNLKQLHATIFGSPWRLRSLCLWRCENLEDLTGLVHLSSLESLQLTNCKRLECIPQLPSSLCSLYASGCTNLRTMSDVSDLKTLGNLNLGDCKMLEDVPGLENISGNLKCLELPGPYDFMGCCHLSQDFKTKVFKNKETTFGGLEKFVISGPVVRGSTTGMQKLHFMLPKLPFIILRSAWLSLWLKEVVPPIHVLIMADDTIVFEKTVEVIEGNWRTVVLNLREESFMNIGEGEKDHCYKIQVTADVSQLESVWLGLTI